MVAMVAMFEPEKSSENGSRNKVTHENGPVNRMPLYDGPVTLKSILDLIKS